MPWDVSGMGYGEPDKGGDDWHMYRAEPLSASTAPMVLYRTPSGRLVPATIVPSHEVGGPSPSGQTDPGVGPSPASALGTTSTPDAQAGAEQAPTKDAPKADSAPAGKDVPTSHEPKGSAGVLGKASPTQHASSGGADAPSQPAGQADKAAGGAKGVGDGMPANRISGMLLHTPPGVMGLALDHASTHLNEDPHIVPVMQAVCALCGRKGTWRALCSLGKTGALQDILQDVQDGADDLSLGRHTAQIILLKHPLHAPLMADLLTAGDSASGGGGGGAKPGPGMAGGMSAESWQRDFRRSVKFLASALRSMSPMVLLASKDVDVRRHRHVAAVGLMDLLHRWALALVWGIPLHQTAPPSAVAAAVDAEAALAATLRPPTLRGVPQEGTSPSSPGAVRRTSDAQPRGVPSPEVEREQERFAQEESPDRDETFPLASSHRHQSLDSAESRPVATLSSSSGGRRRPLSAPSPTAAQRREAARLGDGSGLPPRAASSQAARPGEGGADQLPGRAPTPGMESESTTSDTGRYRLNVHLIRDDDEREGTVEEVDAREESSAGEGASGGVAEGGGCSGEEDAAPEPGAVRGRAAPPAALAQAGRQVTFRGRGEGATPAEAAWRYPGADSGGGKDDDGERDITPREPSAEEGKGEEEQPKPVPRTPREMARMGLLRVDTKHGRSGKDKPGTRRRDGSQPTATARPSVDVEQPAKRQAPGDASVVPFDVMDAHSPRPGSAGSVGSRPSSARSRRSARGTGAVSPRSTALLEKLSDEHYEAVRENIRRVPPGGWAAWKRIKRADMGLTSVVAALCTLLEVPKPSLAMAKSMVRKPGFAQRLCQVHPSMLSRRAQRTAREILKRHPRHGGKMRSITSAFTLDDLGGAADPDADVLATGMDAPAGLAEEDWAALQTSLRHLHTWCILTASWTSAGGATGPVLDIAAEFFTDDVVDNFRMMGYKRPEEAAATAADIVAAATASDTPVNVEEAMAAKGLVVPTAMRLRIDSFVQAKKAARHLKALSRAGTMDRDTTDAVKRVATRATSMHPGKSGMVTRGGSAHVGGKSMGPAGWQDLISATGAQVVEVSGLETPRAGADSPQQRGRAPGPMDAHKTFYARPAEDGDTEGVAEDALAVLEQAKAADQEAAQSEADTGASLSASASAEVLPLPFDLARSAVLDLPDGHLSALAVLPATVPELVLVSAALCILLSVVPCSARSRAMLRAPNVLKTRLARVHRLALSSRQRFVILALLASRRLRNLTREKVQRMGSTLATLVRWLISLVSSDDRPAAALPLPASVLASGEGYKHALQAHAAGQASDPHGKSPTGPVLDVGNIAAFARANARLSTTAAEGGKEAAETTHSTAALPTLADGTEESGGLVATAWPGVKVPRAAAGPDPLLKAQVDPVTACCFRAGLRAAAWRARSRVHQARKVGLVYSRSRAKQRKALEAATRSAGQPMRDVWVDGLGRQSRANHCLDRARLGLLFLETWDIKSFRRQPAPGRDTVMAAVVIALAIGSEDPTWSKVQHLLRGTRCEVTLMELARVRPGLAEEDAVNALDELAKAWTQQHGVAYGGRAELTQPATIAATHRALGQRAVDGDASMPYSRRRVFAAAAKTQHKGSLDHAAVTELPAAVWRGCPHRLAWLVAQWLMRFLVSVQTRADRHRRAKAAE